jgi:hypothetical protein
MEMVFVGGSNHCHFSKFARQADFRDPGETKVWAILLPVSRRPESLPSLANCSEPEDPSTPNETLRHIAHRT